MDSEEYKESLLKRFDELVYDYTGTPVYIANNPLECMVNGAEKVLEDTTRLKKLSSKR